MSFRSSFTSAIIYSCLFWRLASELAQAEELPGTQPLVWEEEDLSSRLMDGAHLFVERKITEAPSKRGALWSKDFSSPEAYARSIEPNRERFKAILGAVDKRLDPDMERYGNDANPALVAETKKYRVYQVRWPVLDGLWGYGLLAQPVNKAVARLVVIPDADETPERLLGLATRTTPQSQGIRRLAENDFELLIMQTVSRDKLPVSDPQIVKSDQTCREWIYRQGFHMGRHLIGLEAQMAMSGVDWFDKTYGSREKVGICGYGEGGLVALYAAAIDPRIDAALVSGYFDSRQEVWKEPIYRNVWSLLREFGDAEIAGLVLPRGLVIETCAAPVAVGHKGDLKTPDLKSVSQEVQRINIGGSLKRPELINSDSGPYSDDALKAFSRELSVTQLAALSGPEPVERRHAFNPARRHERLMNELEVYIQGLIPKADPLREKEVLFALLPELAESKLVTDPTQLAVRKNKFIENSKAVRNRFHVEAMGKFDEPLLPFNARSRLIKETDKWKAYDIVLDVFPELFAWGILVLPKDLKPGEKRPVVVCQHGRNGIPRIMLDLPSTNYNNIGVTLADRGFIVFSPHNLYRGEDRYRWLTRKANTVKATLFSFIIPSHDQILRWLESQPFVDARRIGFYGLSYGGESAVRIPTILENYALSICSADFNQWTRKVASTDQPFSFMRTIEWEMPYWNLGNTFDYAEMTYLMVPRPFMVERGHFDGVGKDQWVAHEYAKVRWLYDQLGLNDKTEIEVFQGGHAINAVGTVEFLHKHLNWPRPGEAAK